MYAEIAAALQSTKALAELLKAAKSVSNYNELTSAVAQVNARLMDATAVALAVQEQQAGLAEKVRELEKQLLDARSWADRIARYELFAFPETGTLAFKLRGAEAGGEPLHYLCVTCAEAQRGSVLQPSQSRRVLHCPTCQTAIHTESAPRPATAASVGPWAG